MKRLRVAVPRAVTEASPLSGHGRMWRHVLAELAPHVELKVGGGRRVDVHLVDGHGPFTELTGPVVAQVHEASWDEPGTREGVAKPFLDDLRDRTLPWVARADRVVVPSRWSADQVSALGGRPVVAHHGVDPVVFAPAGERATDEVLFVGTVQPRKNLTAVREAAAAIGGLTLTVVVGPTHDRPDSRDLMDAALAPLPGTAVRRELAPTDEDLARLMARCTVFCLPSLAEGFGLPVLEAMACGAPVVVSDRGALPEVVESAGVVVPLERVEDGLRAALSDRDRLGAAARERAVALPWSRTAQRWLTALQQAVEGSS
ncbi:MAG: putative glycosyl transferase family 1 [Frankiales bacterium]|nr:putative glycosyl transferase family 1 [Frankiales bacterium]